MNNKNRIKSKKQVKRAMEAYWKMYVPTAPSKTFKEKKKENANHQS